MIARVALFIASLLASVPAVAQSLSPEAARQLVTNKQFVFTCIDGSRGLGEIHDDGSVIGAFQVSGSGPLDFASAGDPQGEGSRRMRQAQRLAVRAVL